MLSLTLKQGEYMTIGEDVVIQLDRAGAERCKLVIDAPREVPVLRGAVRERSGAQRPGCVFDSPRSEARGVRWDRSKDQALSAMRKLLYQMDGRDQNVRDLRRQLNHMFPDGE